MRERWRAKKLRCGAKKIFARQKKCLRKKVRKMGSTKKKKQALRFNFIFRGVQRVMEELRFSPTHSATAFSSSFRRHTQRKRDRERNRNRTRERERAKKLRCGAKKIFARKKSV